jgi:hypothetical protein
VFTEKFPADDLSVVSRAISESTSISAGGSRRPQRSQIHAPSVRRCAAAAPNVAVAVSGRRLQRFAVLGFPLRLKESSRCTAQAQASTGTRS